MHGGHAPHGAAAEGYIGGLGRGSDDTGQVKKIGVVGRLDAWKVNARRLPSLQVGVVAMRIVQSKHHLHERPGRQDGECGECRAPVTRAAVQFARQTELGHDRTQTHDRRRDGQHERGHTAFVVLQRADAHACMRRPEHHAQVDRKIEQYRHVPTDDGPGGGKRSPGPRQQHRDDQPDQRARDQCRASPQRGPPARRLRRRRGMRHAPSLTAMLRDGYFLCCACARFAYRKGCVLGTAASVAQ